MMKRKGMWGWVMACLFILNIPSVHATQLDLYQHSMWPSKPGDLQQAIHEVEALNTFKATIRLKDLDKEDMIAETIVYGNQELGQVDMTTRYHEVRDHRDRLVMPGMTFRMIAADDFRTVAYNLGEMLVDSGFLQTVDRPDAVKDLVTHYQNTYMTVTTPKEIPAYTGRLVDLFMIRPDINKLEKMDSQYFSTDGTTLQMMAARIDLPLDLFQHPTYFSANLDVNLEKLLLPQVETHDDVFGIRISMQEQSPKFWHSIRDLFYQQNTRQQRHYALDSQQSLGKLTHVLVQVKPKEQTYYLKARGIQEQMDLNLLEEATAKFQTHTYQLEVIIEPSVFEGQEITDYETIQWEDYANQLEDAAYE